MMILTMPQSVTYGCFVSELVNKNRSKPRYVTRSNTTTLLIKRRNQCVMLLWIIS